MSKKSAKNKKTKSKPSAKKSAKNRTWTAPTIIGLIVSVVGAVGAIELRPQMVIAPQQPTEKAEPYSVPFDIENSGYLSFYIEHVYCYVHEVTIGQTTINSNLLHYNDLDGITLGRGEGVSPLC